MSQDVADTRTIPEDAGGPVLEDSDQTTAITLEQARNRVILGDTFSVLAKLPAECADMIFIDPPYFLQLPPKKDLRRWTVKTRVEGVGDEWDKFGSFEEYDAFITRLLTEVRRLMKPSATIWVIATYHSLYRIGKAMQDLGFWMLNDVIWVKTNPMPNWLGVRFTNATESMIWAMKDSKAKGHTFNRDQAKRLGIGKVAANVWMLPICTGGERLKDETGTKLHSTQKPVALLKRVILTSTAPGDLVLDPVAGTGTTGHVAQALDRDFIMVEISPKYVAGIVERLNRPLVLRDEAPAETADPTECE
jgi:DNA modification methylase